MKRFLAEALLDSVEKVNDYEGQFEEGTGVYRITVIRPGQGSCGVYTAENLEASASLFAPGTHMFLDHPGPGDRPERSVKDLAGVFLEGASVEEDGSLSTLVRVFPSFNNMIREKFDAIGVSINAWTYHENDADNVVPVFDGVTSVDFVTRAGAGGAITEVLESEDPNTEGDHMEEKLDALLEAVSALGTRLEEAFKPFEKKDEKPAEEKPAEAPAEKPEEDEEKKDKKKVESAALAAFKVAKADLPDASAERVLAALESGVGADVDALIEAERKYIESVQRPVAGVITESDDAPVVSAFVTGA